MNSPNQNRAEMFEENIWNEMRKEALGARLQHDVTLQLVVKAVAATLDRALSSSETNTNGALSHLHRMITEAGKPQQ